MLRGVRLESIETTKFEFKMELKILNEPLTLSGETFARTFINFRMVLPVSTMSSTTITCLPVRLDRSSPPITLTSSVARSSELFLEFFLLQIFVFRSNVFFEKLVFCSTFFVFDVQILVIC